MSTIGMLACIAPARRALRIPAHRSPQRVVTEAPTLDSEHTTKGPVALSLNPAASGYNLCAWQPHISRRRVWQNRCPRRLASPGVPRCHLSRRVGRRGAPRQRLDGLRAAVGWTATASSAPVQRLRNPLPNGDVYPVYAADPHRPTNTLAESFMIGGSITDTRSPLTQVATGGRFGMLRFGPADAR